MAPSGSESVGRLAKSSVSQSVSDRSSISAASFTASFFAMGVLQVGTSPFLSDSETLPIF